LKCGRTSATRFILTKAVLASIPELVASGLSLNEIAERLGCKLSTLKVRCYQERIPLPCRRRGPRGARHHQASGHR
jgi:hypothetical protein